MPYVNIRVTRENGTPTAEQKAELIKGATELLVRVLGKNPATTVVVHRRGGYGPTGAWAAKRLPGGVGKGSSLLPPTGGWIWMIPDK